MRACAQDVCVRQAKSRDLAKNSDPSGVRHRAPEFATALGGSPPVAILARRTRGKRVFGGPGGQTPTARGVLPHRVRAG
jgi:hypothetical protein